MGGLKTRTLDEQILSYDYSGFGDNIGYRAGEPLYQPTPEGTARGLNTAATIALPMIEQAIEGFDPGYLKADSAVRNGLRFGSVATGGALASAQAATGDVEGAAETALSTAMAIPATSPPVVVAEPYCTV